MLKDILVLKMSPNLADFGIKISIQEVTVFPYENWRKNGRVHIKLHIFSSLLMMILFTLFFQLHVHLIYKIIIRFPFYYNFLIFLICFSYTICLCFGHFVLIITTFYDYSHYCYIILKRNFILSRISRLLHVPRLFLNQLMNVI